MKKHFAFAQLLLLSSLVLAHADTKVEFFATVSESSDTTMISMTTDLLYKQLQGLSGYTVIDRRDTTFSLAQAPKAGIGFYAEIQEAGDGSWICTLNAVKDASVPVSESKAYASYYKILLDAKASLEGILASVENPGSGSATAVRAADAQGSLDGLAGTWSGEDQIDKVIILKSGKGFVIFKNGASMNISVSVSGSTVTVLQNGRANAAFFPELPHELALKNAASARPITWSLTMQDEGTLRGTKTTLIADASSATGTASGDLPVEWVKR